MKTLSKKGKYALRALYHLAREHGRGPVLIATLSKQESIPHKFLELILLHLKNNGLVESRKGRNGGYALARPPETITIGSIIRLIDGPLAPLPCASETAYRKCEECVDESVCGTRIVMRKVRNAMAEILDNTTLADVCKDVDSRRKGPDVP
ncbi:MAG TPA: Rrf2 family transcriptional regulator, partial [Bryobacteraceae bacterium]|nr:Rrf2 family transcriptional regulator [Bryobacteraceae bacterium]